MAGAEQARLLEVPKGRAPWRRWGPYLSERGWGTVREDSMILFHEYFHGDTGAGLGASHQTGWTDVVANLILGRRR